jgi:hypothetical protein
MQITRFIVLLSLVLTTTLAGADQQQMAPGTGLQGSVVLSTGPDGICNTAAALGDVQAAPVGFASPNQTEIRCGVNKIVDTAASGDDVQLIAVGAACKNANRAIIDTGEDGIPDSTPIGDDVYAAGVLLGVPPSGAPCVIAGADGVAQTAAPAGDDVQLLTAGTAEPSTAVVLCGPNGLSDTAANNAGAGDDVQVIAVGNACASDDVVVDSGLDGIATTLAVGPDLRIAATKPVKISIKPGSTSGRKTVKLTVSNVEAGPGAPASRGFRISATGGSCPGGTVKEVDADAAAAGLQATGTAPLGAKVKASLVAEVNLEDVTTISTKNPFRCTFDVTVTALDTDPEVDDAANPENNETRVHLEVTDRND